MCVCVCVCVYVCMYVWCSYMFEFILSVFLFIQSYYIMDILILELGERI